MHSFFVSSLLVASLHSLVLGPYTVYRVIFVLKIFRVTIIHVKKFPRTAVIKAILFNLNDSNLAVLAVLLLARRPSFFGKIRAAAHPRWS